MTSKIFTRMRNSRTEHKTGILPGRGHISQCQSGRGASRRRQADILRRFSPSSAPEFSGHFKQGMILKEQTLGLICIGAA
jgi:hypothetical protein